MLHLALRTVAGTVCPHLAGEAARSVLRIQLMPYVCQTLLYHRVTLSAPQPLPCEHEAFRKGSPYLTTSCLFFHSNLTVNLPSSRGNLGHCRQNDVFALSEGVLLGIIS